MRNVKSVAFILSTAALLSACSTPVKVAEPAKVEEKPVATTPTPEQTRPVAPVNTASIDPLDDPKGVTERWASVLAQRSVYFDFDSYVVREDGKPVVQNHSDYLTKNAKRSILIQGNTDERGGAEYNLALGQKRAEAVRKAMTALG
eukprot:gene36505-41313_t